MVFHIGFGVDVRPCTTQKKVCGELLSAPPASPQEETADLLPLSPALNFLAWFADRILQPVPFSDLLLSLRKMS